MNTNILYFFGIANFMFFISMMIGGYIGYFLLKILDIHSMYTVFMVMVFSVFNVFLAWLWFSDLARQAFIDFMKNK